MIIPRKITTLLLLLVLATAVPLSLVSGYSVYGEARNAERQTFDKLNVVVGDVSGDTKAFLLQAVEHIEYLARQPKVRLADPASCGPLLTEVQRMSASRYSIVAAVDGTGKGICWSLDQNATETSYADREWFREAMASSGFRFGKPLIGRRTGELVVPLALPFTNNGGKTSGVLLIGITLREINRLAETNRGLPRNAVVTVTSREGIIIARSLDPQKWLGQDGRRIPAIAAQIARKEGAGTLMGADGVERVNVFSTMPLTGWIVSVGIPAETLAAEYRARLTRSVVATALVTVAALAFAIFWAQRIRKPILSLAAAARATAYGHLDTRADETGPKEVVAVAREFNHMNETRAAIEAMGRALEHARYARRLIEASLEPMVTISKEGKIDDVNHATEQATGVPRLELIGTDFADYFTEPEKAREIYRKVLEEGLVRDYPLTIRRHAGQATEVLYNATTYTNEAGELQGVFATAHDITERKRIEAIGQARLNRVQQQIDATGRIALSDALMTGDIGRLAREITEEAARITGVERANVWLFNDDDTELHCIDLYEATPQKHTAGAILRAQQFPHEFQVLKTTRYVDADDPVNDPRTAGYAADYLKPLRITSMLDAVVQTSGKHFGVLCLEHVNQPHHWEQDEITFACQLADKLGLATANRTRLLAQTQLTDSEQRFRALIEQSISGFYLIQDDKFVYVNARFAEIFGYASPEKIVGMSPRDLTAAKDRATVAENIRRRLSGEVNNISYSFTGVRKDGSELDLGAHGTYASYDGRPAIIGLLQDISERKRAEDEVKRYIVRLEHAMHSTIGVINAIGDARDPYTRGHERRVGELAAAIGTEMGLGTNRVEGIRIAGYMHDVGKIGIPAEILSKPAKLTRPEYDLVKSHVLIGYEILKDVDFPWPVAQIALQHHERLDGSGYPHGLKGDEIILDARVLAVADTVEAMTSHRPYRPGLGAAVALDEIEKGSGVRYDARVVDACLRLFHEKGYQLPE